MLVFPVPKWWTVFSEAQPCFLRIMVLKARHCSSVLYHVHVRLTFPSSKWPFLLRGLYFSYRLLHPGIFLIPNKTFEKYTQFFVQSLFLCSRSLLLRTWLLLCVKSEPLDLKREVHFCILLWTWLWLCVRSDCWIWSARCTPAFCIIALLISSFSSVLWGHRWPD